MNRSTLDKLLSSAGLVVAAVLLLASAGLFWAHNFVHTQVHDQLAQQKIFFPPEGPALSVLPAADAAKVGQYAGQQVLTGAQAEVFADHYIAAHLEEIGGGQTYAQLSSRSMASPSDQKLAGQVQTLFRGETLRGLLLNAYAFDTMAMVAYYAAAISLAAGLVLVALSALGFRHAGAAKHR